MIKKCFSIVSFLFLSSVIGLAYLQATPIFSVPSADAFSMTIAPAKKVVELRRGDTYEYPLLFRNNDTTADYALTVVDFAYGPSGSREYIQLDDVADLNQSLTSWIKVPEKFSAVKGVNNEFSIKIVVPENASFGDHFGRIVLNEVVPPGTKNTVSIGGGIASVLMIKVLGGEGGIKAGTLVDYQIETRAKARNTANFRVKFKNVGNEFFNILAKIEVFEKEGVSEPIKRFSRSTIIYPNVVHEIVIPLGDMGDDVGEGEYLSRLVIYELEDGEEVREMARELKSFQYYLPLTSDPKVKVIEKEVEVVVLPTIVDFIKELILYIGGFLVLLIVFVWILLSRTKKIVRK